ncbi:MAG: hypothetical protein QM736_28405 [Vicinamibacterales bacterium]
MRAFNVVIERDPDTRLFVGYLPGWPTLKPRDVVALLQAVGFVRRALTNSSATRTGAAQPFRAGRDISPTLLRTIAKDVDLTAENFFAATRVTDRIVIRRSRHVVTSELSSRLPI